MWLSMNVFIDGLKQRNEEIIMRFVTEYQQKIFHFLWKYIGDFHETEDLVQEALLRVVRNIDSFTKHDFFNAWVYKIASNIARDHLRKKKRVHLKIITSEIADYENPHLQLVNQETHLQILKAIQELPIEQREVFLMRQEADLSFKEIAQILDVSINTALGRMHYAVEKLRNKLEGAV